MQLFLDMLHTCPTLQLATCTGIDKGDLKRIVGSLALASKATRIVAKVRRHLPFPSCGCAVYSLQEES